MATQAEQALEEGNVVGALKELSEQIRRDPSNAELRTFLFQLLSVAGQWDRALTQLNVAGDLDPATLAMVQIYRDALSCEALRAEVFAGRRTPLVFGEPEEWVALLLEALRVQADGRANESRGLRDRAFDAAPVTPGRIDGTPFAWIADADMRLGPVLEVVLNGRYYWVPFHRIARIVTEEPIDLRDFVWTPAQFTWANGGQAVGLIPTRYAGSETSDDPKVAMARKTEWVEQGEGFFVGVGQRMLATDIGENSLLDVRQLEIGDLGETESGEEGART